MVQQVVATARRKNAAADLTGRSVLRPTTSSKCSKASGRMSAQSMSASAATCDPRPAAPRSAPARLPRNRGADLLRLVDELCLCDRGDFPAADEIFSERWVQSARDVWRGRHARHGQLDRAVRSKAALPCPRKLIHACQFERSRCRCKGGKRLNAERPTPARCSSLGPRRGGRGRCCPLGSRPLRARRRRATRGGRRWSPKTAPDRRACLL